MLIVEHLSMQYKQEFAVHDLNFTVEAGQIAVLLGPNGAGKTTTINCISGLLNFDGNIYIDGYKNDTVEAKAALGIVPEVSHPYDYLTIQEHLEYIARAYKLKDWRQHADSLLQQFNLSKEKDKLGKELSKGMKQKLNICCALLTNPKLLIFDEPVIGLDPFAISDLKALYVKLRNRGCAILISTHILDTISDIWDVAYIMNSGILVQKVYRQELTQDSSIDEIFFSVVNEKI